ncbi:LexA family protein [Christensenella massiliensis]|uniref:S24 family peptidase n=1 Tax=Christensenella massiliensis TaxID=1805714 RepID=A0AAU8ACF6_9FIRM
MKNDKVIRFMATVAGNCMEAVGIRNGDMVLVGKNIPPRNGDIVVCEIAGREAVKMYLGRTADGFAVCTRYKDSGHNKSYIAQTIAGVVTEVYTRRAYMDIDVAERFEREEKRKEEEARYGGSNIGGPGLAALLMRNFDEYKGFRKGV